MASTQRVAALQFPSQEISTLQPVDGIDFDESAEFGDVSEETREMVEADFFGGLRGGVA